MDKHIINDLSMNTLCHSVQLYMSNLHSNSSLQVKQRKKMTERQRDRQKNTYYLLQVSYNSVAFTPLLIYLNDLDFTQNVCMHRYKILNNKVPPSISLWQQYEGKMNMNARQGR